ncbi:MAG: hypothetical protein ACEQSX_01260 [Baekduiaceae bacterium]
MGWRYAALTLAAAPLLAACGESPRERFVSDADAVCERVNREFGERIEDPDALAKVRPVARQAQADLDAIDAPAEYKQKFARYLKVNRERIDLLAAALKDLITDVYADPKMKRAEVFQTRSGEIVRDLGFEHCS